MKKWIGMWLSSVLTVTLAFSVSAATVENHWVKDQEGGWGPVPVSYVPEDTTAYFGEAGSLYNPQDIFYRDGLLYIADTGNNRIVVMDTDAQVKGVYTGGEIPFNSPNGVYADEDGDIYIADTNNSLIVHLAPDGTFVESFGKPESELYDEIYDFKPMKLCIDNIGQFYIINYEDYHGFIVMDALGEFKGYVAPTKVETTWLDQVVRFFASAEQKEQLDQKKPPVHTNFVMDEEGALYVTTGRVLQEQLKKFLSSGDNIFPFKGVFGYGSEYSNIADVSVSATGIITLLESDTGELFQYDSDGVNLANFGGAGNWSGVFMSASSLCEDEDGNLYVLDAGTGAVTTLRPTSFIKNVHEGLSLYHEGKYEESIQPWEEILAVDRNYAVARIGLGKAYMRQERYEDALEQYKLADYRQGYSEAFAEMRHEIFRSYFGWIVLGVLALILGGFFLVRAGKRWSKKQLGKM